MAIWICGKPKRKAHQAVLFVDYDNFAIDGDIVGERNGGQPWVPKPGINHPAHILRMAQAFGGAIAQHVPLLYVFVNIRTGSANSEMEQVCLRRGFILVHCPRQHRRDTVDNVMTRTMLQVESTLGRNRVIGVISADRDFLPAFQRVSRTGRSIYLGLPTNEFTPRHARPGRNRILAGSAWVDPEANFHRAMYFLLRPKELPGSTRDYIHGKAGFGCEYPYFRQLRGALNVLARRAISETRLTLSGDRQNLDALIQWMVVSWRDAEYHGFARPEAQRIAPYLVAYRFMRSEDPHRVLRPNLAHQIVQRVRSRSGHTGLKLLQAEAS